MRAPRHLYSFFFFYVLNFQELQGILAVMSGGTGGKMLPVTAWKGEHCSR